MEESLSRAEQRCLLDRSSAEGFAEATYHPCLRLLLLLLLVLKEGIDGACGFWGETAFFTV